MKRARLSVNPRPGEVYYHRHIDGKLYRFEIEPQAPRSKVWYARSVRGRHGWEDRELHWMRLARWRKQVRKALGRA